MNKLSRFSISLAIATIAATPLAAAAQTGINLDAITPYSNGIIDFINTVLVRVLFSLSFLYFLWGVYKYYFYHGDSDTERAKGKWFIMWGIIAFVVIISVWGLVNVVSGTFGLSGIPAPTPPKL